MQEFSLIIHLYTPPIVFWIIAAVILGILLYVHRKREAFIYVLALFATTATVSAIKLLTASPRPLEALVEIQSYAFPSGHAAGSAFLATILIWLFSIYSQRSKAGRVFFGIILYALAYMVGYSRVLIDVHTPLQVLAGFAIGISVPLLIIFFFRKRLAVLSS